MQYISQINAFWNWRRLNEISHAQVDLYFTILNCGNSCGWKTEFNIPNSTIIGMCQISASELAKHRNALIQKGLIRYRKGNKKNAGSYSITPLYDSNLDINLDINPDINLDINPDINHENIPRVKTKSKTKNKPPISPLDVFAKVEDEQLRGALCDFEKMRKTMKKPMTERAKELLLAKLRDMTENKDEQIAILNQSIMNNWQGVFALKDKPRGVNYEDDGDFLGR